MNISPQLQTVATSTAAVRRSASPALQFGQATGDRFNTTEVVEFKSLDALAHAAHQAVVKSAISGRETKLAFDGVETTVRPYKMSPDEAVENFQRDYSAAIAARRMASGERVNEQLNAVQQWLGLDEAAKTQMHALIGPISKELQHVGQLPNGELIILARAKDGTTRDIGPYRKLYFHVFQGQPGQLQQLDLKDLGQWGNTGYSGETANGQKMYFPGWGMQDKPAQNASYSEQNKAFNWAQQLSGVLDLPELRENVGLVRQIIVDGQPTANYRDFSRKQA